MTAQQVLPNLKHIWDDEGWEDHWWPQGMETGQANPAPLAF